MRKRLLMFLPLLAMLLAFMSTADCYGSIDVTLLNRQFIRGESSPVTEVTSFPSASGPAIIEVFNGGLGDSAVEKVSSSIVTLNGNVVFDSTSFNQNVTVLRQEVVLRAGTNNLSITLRGKPGGTVVARIIQQLQVEGAAVIGSKGGAVTVADPTSPAYGARCLVPPNALTEEKVLTINVAELPMGSGHERGIGTPIDFGPNGTTFSTPVTLTLPYQSQEVVSNRILSEKSLKLYHLNEENQKWASVDESSVDTATKEVSARVIHFSIYEVMGGKLFDVNSIIQGLSPEARPEYDPAKKQVLFLHGFQPPLLSGSGYADFEKDDNPFGNAPKFFTEFGDVQVWYLSYDSWHDIGECASTLSEALTKIRSLLNAPDKKISIIAHSMGGLVTRWYLERNGEYQQDVDRVLFLGTPNSGANYANLVDAFIDPPPPSVDEMKTDNNLFLMLLNEPSRFPRAMSVIPSDISVVNVYNTDIEGGDGIVLAEHAKLASLFPDQNNITDKPLQAQLAHFRIWSQGWPKGIAQIVSSGDYQCDIKESCSHPSWGIMKEILSTPEAPNTSPKIAAGYSHTVTIRTDGTVWSWGGNYTGQLGDGTFSTRYSPVQAIGVSGITAVSAGTYHTLALKNDGTVFGWGSNQYSELGGSDLNYKVPQKLEGLSEIFSVAAGENYSAAVRKDGTVRTWGWNVYGQLGDGTTNWSRSTPYQVQGITDVSAVALGGHHVIALKNDGTVWSWGSNGSGQLGDGTTTARLTPVQVNGLADIIAIAGGWAHNVALKKDGTVWTWGSDYSGAIGDGLTTNRLTPFQVPGISGVVSVGAGSYYSAAAKSDGTVWTWGWDYATSNGTGAIKHATPTPMSGLSGITTIVPGPYHSFAIKNDNTLWAWGLNPYNVFGIPWTEKAPVLVGTAP